MYSFANDYSEGAHPRILEALVNNNLIQNPGYGLDSHCEHAAELIRQRLGQTDADIHFLVGGTQTNLLAISTALRPYQAAISASTGHINVHETGAVEGTGHKVLAIPTADGKLTPELVEACLTAHTDEHMVQPKLVYISNSTEIGTQYTKAELEALSHFCRQHGLYLFLDGARLGSALTSSENDMTLADLAENTDLFYIGGTKNGALLGEALVLINPELKKDFRFMIKNRGAMLAKGWIAGIQFEELFRDNLFFELAAHANEAAQVLRKGIADLGYAFDSASGTNQLFPIFPNTVIEALKKEFTVTDMNPVDGAHSVIRLVTSWATPPKAPERFLEVLRSLTAR